MSKIDNLVKQINREFKTEILRSGAELEKVEMIPFSSPQMNYLTRGGIAKGKVAEFFGTEGSGKTTTALDLMGSYQTIYDDFIVFLDAENTIDAEWGEKMGVDWDRVILIKPESQSAEVLLDIVIAAIKTGEVGLVIIDSIPFLIPEAQLTGDLEQKHYGGNSIVMTQFTQKIVPHCNKYETTLIGINQVRDMIGVPYTAYNTPGGRAWKHACSQRIQFYKGKLLDKNGNEVPNSYESPQGNKVKVNFVKNKVTKNDRTKTTYTLDYDLGVDIVSDTVVLGLYLGVINQAGAWFDYTKDNGEVIKKQGSANFIKELRTDKDLFIEIKDKVNKESLK